MSILGGYPHQPLGVGTHEFIDINVAKQMNYSTGAHSHYVGGAKEPESQVLRDLGAKIQHVRGDGSCWARATWQCVLSQVLDDDRAFTQFVNKIAVPKKNYEISENYAKETIHILYQLRGKTPEQRIEYLNHVKVDDSLVYFMRHVAAEYMEKENFGLVEADQLPEIKTNKNKYGGPEVIAFMRYFGLETHYIRKKPNGEMEYQYSRGDHLIQKINLSQAGPQAIPRDKHCIFAVNELHYEFVNFENAVTMTDTMAKLIAADGQLAFDLQLEELAAQGQEQADAKLAAEIEEADKLVLADTKLAAKLSSLEASSNAIHEYLTNRDKRSEGKWTLGPKSRLISVENPDGTREIRCAGIVDRIKCALGVSGYSFDLWKIKESAQQLHIDDTEEFKNFWDGAVKTKISILNKDIPKDSRADTVKIEKMAEQLGIADPEKVQEFKTKVLDARTSKVAVALPTIKPVDEKLAQAKPSEQPTVISQTVQTREPESPQKLIHNTLLTGLHPKIAKGQKLPGAVGSTKMTGEEHISAMLYQTLIVEQKREDVIIMPLY
ncbi:MAG: hypothetical protein JSR46_04450, partial [Verrucomicrobia bacterium]|nr:hypothetical protein [Verrucomicrobiota bacterium]